MLLKMVVTLMLLSSIITVSLPFDKEIVFLLGIIRDFPSIVAKQNLLVFLFHLRNYILDLHVSYNLHFSP